MDKDKIQTRLDALQREFAQAKLLYEQSRDNVDALAGAIQDCQFWLSQFEDKDKN